MIILILKHIRRLFITAYLAFVCFICLGAVRLISFNMPSDNDIRDLVGGEPTLATIRGVIATEPYIDRSDWRFSRFTHTDCGSSFYLKLTEVEAVNGWVKASGRVRVRLNEPIIDLKTGDYIQAYCRLNKFDGATNPGEFDIAAYMARKGVFVACTVESREAIEFLRSGQAGLLKRIGTRLRFSAMQRLSGELPNDSIERGLIEALLLGSRSKISSEVYRAFGETGLLHFISLSGMHLGIIAGIAWRLSGMFGLMKRGQAAVCIIAVIVFVLTVPPRDPTIRAAIIIIVYCVPFFFRRRSNSLNSLSLAAIILLLARPTGLFEAGWQLSFASVLGILAFCRRFHLFLYEKITGHSLSGDLMKPFYGIVPRPGPAILALFTTGLSAWMGSAGVLLYHFYTINPLASVWTALTFPFVAMILTFGFLKILLSFILPTIAGLLGVFASFLTGVLIWIVEFIARLNISEILIGHTSIWLIILYYAFVLFTGFFYFNRPALKRVICVASASFILMYLVVVKWEGTYGGDLTITALDVGHGQALVANLPGGVNMLFDAGSLSRNDIGTRVVAPYLRYKGISKLDAVVISHGDIDHINGLPEVAANTRTKAIYASNAFFKDNRPTKKFLLDELPQIVEFNNVPQKFGSSKLTVLWPTPDFWGDNTISDNDKSIVTLLEYAGMRILLCSDIEKFAQAELMRLYPDLKADVMLAPHHGSVKTLERSFVNAVEPNVVISSCTRTSYEKGQVVRQQAGFKTYYTGRDGAISVRITKKGTIDVDTYVK
jgi:competence protein ComEC